MYPQIGQRISQGNARAFDPGTLKHRIEARFDFRRGISRLPADNIKTPLENVPDRAIGGIVRDTRARVQTDGVDLGRFRGEVPRATLHHHGAFLVASAPIAAEMPDEEFQPPVAPHPHPRQRQVAGAPEAALQLIDYERRR